MKVAGKKKYFLIIIVLGLIAIIGSISTFQYYKQFKISSSTTNLRTYGIVSGFSSGGRWVRYFVDWQDQNGIHHNISNKNVRGNYPKIGDTIEIIYNKENPLEAVINNNNETIGGFNLTAKITAIFILLFLFSLGLFIRTAR